MSVSPSPVCSHRISENNSRSPSTSLKEKTSEAIRQPCSLTPTALRYVESANGDYLPAGAFAVPAVVTQNAVTLAATALAGVSNGDGTLAALTFEVVAVKASTLTLSDVILSDSAGVGSRPHVENGQVIEAALTPKETALLPNYPNPFNPETWLPYHLAHAADVTLTVYDTKGAVVRQLVLGHQPAGFYTARAKGGVLEWSQRKRGIGRKRFVFLSTPVRGIIPRYGGW